MEYLKYWALFDKPFAHDATSRFYWGQPQREFLAGMHYLAAHDQPIAVLVSTRRCGATCLLRQMETTSGLGDSAVQIVATGGDQLRAEHVRGDLATAIGIAAGETPEQCISSALGTLADQQVKTIWLVDRCRLPAAKVARQLVVEHAMLAAVLVPSVVAGHQLAQLLQSQPLRVDPLFMELPPIELAQTFEYVHTSLESVGGNKEMWSDTAVIRLHELSAGCLADMAMMAEMAMLIGARHRMRTIVPAMIEATCDQNRRAA